MRGVRIRCPAKVNLHLEVLGRRPDGYHELRTLFAAIGVFDELEARLAPAGVLELEVEPAGAAPAGEENLVVRAARALRPGNGCAGARMRLRKAIPAAAGLGGGSSDAAAALVALAALWRLPTDLATLHPLAARLGADVPFFLLGGAAWAIGRGTEAFPLADLPDWWVVVLPGEEPVPTARAYALLGAGQVDETRYGALYGWVAGGGPLPLGACRNDLEPTVAQHWPGVARRIGALRESGAMLAMLSGSGGAVFGLYPGRREADAAAGSMQQLAPLTAPLLGREESRPRPVTEGDDGDH